jgi:hypothetical protein
VNNRWPRPTLHNLSQLDAAVRGGAAPASSGGLALIGDVACDSYHSADPRVVQPVARCDLNPPPRAVGVTNPVLQSRALASTDQAVERPNDLFDVVRVDEGGPEGLGHLCVAQNALVGGTDPDRTPVRSDQCDNVKSLA